MRVTENTNYNVIRDSIRRSRERMEGYQEQSSTLRKLNTPSDDPIGSARLLEIRTDKVINEQMQQNAKMAETFLGNTDQALSEMSEVLVRAKEIAINQASGPSSNEESRLGVAEEVAQLFNQAVSIANRRIGERYLFGGYQTQKPPVDQDGNYKGDEGNMMLEIARDVYLSVNVPGVDAFNTHPEVVNDGKNTYDQPQQRSPAVEGQPPKENVNVFDELQNLRIGLLTGDMDGIRNTLERFDQLHAKVVGTRAKVGSRLQGLQNTASALERHTITNANLSSSIEDADMAQVMSDLAKEETVFKSSLSASRRLIQPTLLDFLK